jgi:hypothetical protein
MNEYGKYDVDGASLGRFEILRGLTRFSLFAAGASRAAKGKTLVRKDVTSGSLNRPSRRVSNPEYTREGQAIGNPIRTFSSNAAWVMARRPSVSPRAHPQ